MAEGPGGRDHGQARLRHGRDQASARIGDLWRARVADQRHRLAARDARATIPSVTRAAFSSR